MRVENVKQLPPGGSVIATFDVYFEEIGLTVHRIKAVRTKKGGTIISLPSYSTEEEFEKKWHPFIEFSPERQREFNMLVYQELKNFGI